MVILMAETLKGIARGSHHFGSQGKGLVNQSRGLERLPGPLLGRLDRRQSSQLVVDRRQKRLGGLPVALLDGR